MASEEEALLPCEGAEGVDKAPGSLKVENAASREVAAAATGADATHDDQSMVEVCISVGKRTRTTGIIPVCQLIRMLWPQAAASSMLHTFMYLETHIYMPYLYTRVHCCDDLSLGLDPKYDVSDGDEVRRIGDEARSLGLEVPMVRDVIPACRQPRFPASSEYWSLSAHCVSKAFVEDTAQSTMSAMKPLQKLFGIVVLPIGGTLADSVGRRPVLTVFGAMLVLASLLSSADALFGHLWGASVVILAGMLFGVSFQPKDTVFTGCVADILGHDEGNKGRAFVLIMTLNTVISAGMTGPMYFILRLHMESYFAPWLVFAAVAGLSVVVTRCVMAETLASDLRRPASCAMFDPLGAQLYALRLVARDPVLVLLCVNHFFFLMMVIGFFTSKTSYLLTVGFVMEETLFPEILSTILQVPMGALIMQLMPHIGPLYGLLGTNVLMFTAFFFIGPYIILFGRSGAYISSALFSAALSLGFPSNSTVVSERVERDHQSKVSAAVAAVGSLGGIVGVLLFNRVFFQATHQGMAKATPAFAAMVLAACCFVISSLATATAGYVYAPVACAPPGAAAAGASQKAAGAAGAPDSDQRS